MRYALAVLALLAIAQAARSDETAWSGWWTVGDLDAAQGLAYGVDSGHVVGDLPFAGETIRHLGLGLEDTAIWYDLLLGTDEEGKVGVVGVGVSLNLGDEFIQLKAGFGVLSSGGAGFYLGASGYVRELLSQFDKMMEEI